MYLIQRADRLDEMISLGYKYHTNIKEIQPILTKENTDPYMVIIKAVKNSKSGLKLKKDIHKFPCLLLYLKAFQGQSIL